MNLLEYEEAIAAIFAMLDNRKNNNNYLNTREKNITTMRQIGKRKFKTGNFFSGI